MRLGILSFVIVTLHAEKWKTKKMKGQVSRYFIYTRECTKYSIHFQNFVLFCQWHIRKLWGNCFSRIALNKKKLPILLRSSFCQTFSCSSWVIRNDEIPTLVLFCVHTFLFPLYFTASHFLCMIVTMHTEHTVWINVVSSIMH